VLVRVPVGNIPAKDVPAHCREVTSSLNDLHDHVIALPTRPDGTGPDISVLKVTDDTMFVTEVPVGNIPLKDIPAYMKLIKDEFFSSTPCKSALKDRSFWVPVLPNGDKFKIRTA